MTAKAGDSAADGMSCSELVALVTDYFENALGPAERARFEDHLRSCPGCVDHLDQMRTTIEAVGQLAEEDVPPPAMDDLLDAFRRWRRSK